jgi:ATP-dependent Clp protease protease subunit
MFQSHGGFIGDGIALYNFYRAFTTPLTLYNTGSVDSIAVIAFLGAKDRKVSKYATFMIHRSHRTMQAATAWQLEEAAASLRIDDARTEAILRAHITLDDTQWKALNYNDLTFNAEQAVEIGMADEIAEFVPPTSESIKYV